MEQLLAFLERFLPFLMLALLLGAMVFAINVLGRRFERHDAWLEALDARVAGLQKDRSATFARHLQRPFATEATEPAPPIVPPPLPPRAPTLDAVDWRDDDAATEDLLTRQTGRYPGGEPPKGSEG